MIDLRDAFEELLALLDRTETAYLVGGSVAAGVHGIARTTHDVDIVVDLPREHVAELCEVLAPSFYADRDVVLRSVELGRSFNVIHIASAHKFDFFPAGTNAFARSQLARRRFVTGKIAGIEDVEFAVASPEDTILAKLVWYRKGGGVSEHQWKDVLGIVALQGESLDRAYLDQWARKLGVSDLLTKILPA